MMAAGGQKEEIHLHSGWWIPAVFFLAVLVLSGLLLGWYLRPGLKPAVPSGQSHTVGVSVGGMFFSIPANYFEPSGAGSERSAVTLVALFPSWQGYSESAARLFAGNAPDSPVIRLSLRTDSNGLDSRARLDRIYRPHFAGSKGENGPFGFTRYGFSASSTYRDYELFTRQTARGLELLLCERASGQFPSPNCLATDRPLAAGVSLSYRFKRAYLAQWQEISMGAERLIAKFRN